MGPIVWGTPCGGPLWLSSLPVRTIRFQEHYLGMAPAAQAIHWQLRRLIHREAAGVAATALVVMVPEEAAMVVAARVQVVVEQADRCRLRCSRQ